MRYTLDLLVFHPSISPETITTKLRMVPQYSWQQGQPRRTPDGKSLPGFYRETMWRRVVIRRGRRDFVEDLNAVVEQLRSHKTFLKKLSSDGGRALLIVNLPGDVNIGGELAPRTLRLMSDLDLKLGVEVFPVMNNA